MKNKILSVISVIAILIGNVGYCSLTPEPKPTAGPIANAGAAAAASGAPGIAMKMVAFKFGMAMLGVVASSLLIFAILTIYNKYFRKVGRSATTVPTKSLESPKNLKDSINIFLEKTKW